MIARSPRTRPPTPRSETRDRLIDAAGPVFAARGYRGATMREIADRAGANLAAAHYHFGSKRDLYREVARTHFERLERRLEESGAAVDPEVTSRLTRAELVELLRARVRTMLGSFLDADGIHAQLMQRELTDPSESLEFIVRRWIDPMRRETEHLLARLAPGMAEKEVQFAARSVMGQVLFYFTHRHALLLMLGRRAYPPGFVDEMTDAIVAFSLGGLDALARQSSSTRPSKRARGAKP
jgi:TetR/AcrR family transcriptional regulator, regulator of cefoperazone and chloramphenicol sensitivity